MGERNHMIASSEKLVLIIPRICFTYSTQSNAKIEPLSLERALQMQNLFAALASSNQLSGYPGISHLTGLFA